MRFLIMSIVFVCGMGLGVALETVDNLILQGADSMTIWVHIAVAVALWPLAMVLYWLGEKL